jgi:hypothetical protein
MAIEIGVWFETDNRLKGNEIATLLEWVERLISDALEYDHDEIGDLLSDGLRFARTNIVDNHGERKRGARTRALALRRKDIA